MWFYCLQEEIDDIIITGPPTPLVPPEVANSPSKESQINSNLQDNSSVVSPDEQIYHETKSEASEALASTNLCQSKENPVVEYRRKQPRDPLEICHQQSQRSEKTIQVQKLFDSPREKLYISLSSLPRRNKVVEDRVIDYKELLNEFGISDNDTAETIKSNDHNNESNVTFQANGDLSSINDNAKLSVICLGDSVPFTNSLDKIDRVSNEMGITASYILNSDYDEPRDVITGDSPEFTKGKSQSFPVKLNESFKTRSILGESQQQRDAASSDYEEPCSTNQTSTSIVSSENNYSSLPTNFPGHESSGHSNRCEIISVLPKNNNCLDLNMKDKQKSSTVETFGTRTNSEVPVMSCPSLTNGKHTSEIVNANPMRRHSEGKEGTSKLPPRQQEPAHGRGRGRVNLPTSPMSQKRRRFLQYGKFSKSGTTDSSTENVEPEVDDVFDVANPCELITRSKSLDGSVASQRSALVTPTDDKRLPFAKILRKRHTPVFRESVSDAVLVRVSSLPDQDLLKLSSNERLRENNVTSPRKIRAVSPLTLRSDVTAKRLSESDKDVSQISPVELKKFPCSRTNVNDVAVSCDLPDSERDTSELSNESARSTDVKFKTSDPVKVIGIDDNNSRLGSVSDKWNYVILFFSRQTLFFIQSVSHFLLESDISALAFLTIAQWLWFVLSQ